MFLGDLFSKPFPRETTSLIVYHLSLIVARCSFRYVEPPAYQRKVAEACFRFMDSDTRFADQELDMLLRGVQDNEK